MVMKVACRNCGASILAETATRTGGRCMVCFRNPETRVMAARVAQMVASASQGDLLSQLEELVTAATLQSARQAATTLQDERVYGFWLMHEYFGMFGTIVFTEADLDKALERHPDETREELRWVVQWPPMNDFQDVELDLVVMALEKQRRALSESGRDELLRSVERLCLRSLRRLRQGGVLDSTVVLSLGAVEQSQEETFVYAEQLCDASTLSSFRGDLPRLREADVAVFRESLVRL